MKTDLTNTAQAYQEDLRSYLRVSVSQQVVKLVNEVRVSNHVWIHIVQLEDSHHTSLSHVSAIVSKCCLQWIVNVFSH